MRIHQDVRIVTSRSRTNTDEIRIVIHLVLLNITIQQNQKSHQNTV